MKILLRCYIIIFLFSGCTNRFVDNVRLLVKGKVEDDFQNPVQDAEVSVYTERGTGFLFAPGPSGSETFLLGRNYSDANGDFSVVSLYDEDKDFSIEINGGEQFTNYFLSANTEDFFPEDYTIDLGSVELKRRSNFNFNINRISGEGNVLEFSFEYTGDYCFEVYENGEVNELESICYQSFDFDGFLNDNRPEISFNLASILESEVVFTYSINDQPEETQIIILDQPEYEFNFSY